MYLDTSSTKVIQCVLPPLVILSFIAPKSLCIGLILLTGFLTLVYVTSYAFCFKHISYSKFEIEILESTPEFFIHHVMLLS